MTAPAPPPTPRRHRGLRRHEGLLVTVVAVGVVVALALSGAFGRTERATSTPGNSGSPSAVRGVTADAVKVVLYQPPEDDAVSKIVARFVAPEDDNAEAEATVRGFIRRAVESTNPACGGRRIDLEVFTGSANLLDSVAARADAVKIAEDIRPYAVLNGPLLGTAFADELASRGVLCLLCVNGGTNAFYADHAPYVWSLQTTPEQVGDPRGRVRDQAAGRAGRPSSPATAPCGGPTRRFGLISAQRPVRRRRPRTVDRRPARRRRRRAGRRHGLWRFQRRRPGAGHDDRPAQGPGGHHRSSTAATPSPWGR